MITRLPSNTKKILVIMSDYHLGNLVISLPTINRLAEYFDNGIHVVVNSLYAGLVRGLPNADKINVIGYDQIKKSRSIRQHLRGIKFISSIIFRYKIVISLSWGIKDTSISLFTCAPIRVGFAKTRRCWLYTRKIPYWSGYRHYSERYASMLQIIGDSKSSGSVKIRADESEQAWVRETLSGKFSTAGPLVIIHPYAGYKFRCWPEDRFISVAKQMISKYDANIILTGGPHELEALEDLSARIEVTDRTMIFSESIDRLLALYYEADLLIANESGPSHVASLSDIPIIALYGPADPEKWRPLRQENIVVLQGPRCDVCLWTKCQLNTQCITSISEQEVLQAAAELISKNKS